MLCAGIDQITFLLHNVVFSGDPPNNLLTPQCCVFSGDPPNNLLTPQCCVFSGDPPNIFWVFHLSTSTIALLITGALLFGYFIWVHQQSHYSLLRRFFWVFHLSTSTIALLITVAVLLGLSFEHINNHITHYWGGSFGSFIWAHQQSHYSLMGRFFWVFHLSTSTIALLITGAVLFGLSFEHINNRINHYWGDLW